MDKNSKYFQNVTNKILFILPHQILFTLSKNTLPKPSCPKCDNDLNYKEKYGQWFCDKCQKFLKKNHDKDSIFCPKCNFKNNEKDKFCYYCGTELKVICPKCMAEYKPGVKFCNRCRYRFFEQEEKKSQPSEKIPPPTPIPVATPVIDTDKISNDYKKSSSNIMSDDEKKSFKNKIAVFIIIITFFLAIFGYQAIILKNEATEEFRKEEETIMRKEAFYIVANQEENYYYDYTQQVEVYEKMTDYYAKRCTDIAIVLYMLNITENQRYQSSYYNDYWDEFTNYDEATRMMKINFYMLLGPVLNKTYSHPTVDQNYEEAKNDFVKFQRDNDEIIVDMEEEANEHLDKGLELNNEANNFGTGVIILAFGALISRLSKNFKRRKIAYGFFIISFIIFISGLLIVMSG